MKITIKEPNKEEQVLFLNFEKQIYNNRSVRLSGTAKNLKVPPKWVDINDKPTLKYHWIYTFRYIDKKDGFVSFEYDFNDKFLCKL